MSADRGAYIDQSQSLNIHLGEPTFGKMSSMHFYAWRKGLKTGLYYLRTRPAADPIKFTVDKSKLKATRDLKIDKENVLKSSQPIINKAKETKKMIDTTSMLKKGSLENSTNNNEETKDLVNNEDLIEKLKMACSLKNKDACTMCSS